MLHKDHISNIEIYSDAWQLIRRGRFTSSRINCLCLDKEFAEGAMTYIYHKVGEVLTGQTLADMDDVVEDENTTWGLQYEPDAINELGRRMKIKFLVTQKLIMNPDKHFSSTPDAIWPISLCENGYEYNVRTIEVKCPRKYHKFIPFYRAKTPAEVRKLSRVYYWQVLDQMDNCGSAVGYFAVYHPLFPKDANMNIVTFNKMDLWEDFKLLQSRKKSAIEKFEEILAEFRPVSQIATSNS